MALYVYVKQKPSAVKRAVSYFSYGAIIIGSLFLFWSFYPVVSFELYSRLVLENKLFKPSTNEAASALTKASSNVGNANIFSTNLADYTQAGIWFPSVKAETPVVSDIKEYVLSIPKLGIEYAKVIVGGDDLKKGLIQYLPKVFPGQYGNVTIFGHSTLPQLYNKKDYKTIFTYLPTLKKGDRITVSMKEKTFEYEIFDTFVITPDKVEILEQHYDDAYLTLVTCCPPGTYWKRCGTKARLVSL